MDRPKFAVVREDAELEALLVGRARTLGRPGGALVVASAGCTALTLAARFPDASVAAFDLSATQLEHARMKQEAVLRRDAAALGVDSDDPSSLLQCGEFEGLFRTLRRFIEEFVAPRGVLLRFFLDLRDDAAARRALAHELFANRYWSVAFDLALHDHLLLAMFGPDATRHAEPGSYPRYFRKAFEGALVEDGAARNPFLQHVLLGHYLSADAPDYLRAERFGPITWVHGSLGDVGDLSRFDVVSLSNVFDWSDDTLVAEWSTILARGTRPGTAVLMRFLNNQRSPRPFFEPSFIFDDALSAQLLERDRSFFYGRIEVAVRA